MSEMKSYLFFEDFPPMEKGFYFFVEKATMKKPLILSQELQKIQEVQEGEIFTLKIGDSRKLEVQKTNDSTSKIILKEITNYKVYENYDGPEENLFYHCHNGFEISMVVSGEGYYFAGGRAIKVKEGSIILFNSLIPHAWIANADNPPIQKTFTFYHRLFLESELAKEEAAIIDQYLKLLTVLDLHGEEAKTGKVLLELMYDEYINKKMNYKTSIRHLLVLFFIYSLRINKSNTIGEHMRKNAHNEQLEVAIQYIKSHFHLTITLEDVAKEVYMHPNYFSTLFKKTYGTNFVEYTNALKIAMAVELMKSTDLSIQEIASKCGFKTISNFYKVFKERYDISPAKYIKQL